MISINTQILPLSQTEANRMKEVATECMVELSDTECMNIVGGIVGGFYNGGSGTFPGGKYEFGPGYSKTVVDGVEYSSSW
ncbi:hypothetical protein [Brasilonema sp. UFV-L1]|uniref:hypothetical protein n=1 Tax=Brasilonema sp. UFV-L1 TaxID=2234130 RepID=UPI00145F3578|nr:hypothetical protein [Brasilonema sp. UFV-L1]NMG11785.1 hypothetical protein [Brasilonema sp. UFV-L1]